MHKRFPGLADDEATDLLWSVTCFPFGSPDKVVKDLALIAAVSGNNASTACKMVWDRTKGSWKASLSKDSEREESPSGAR